MCELTAECIYNSHLEGGWVIRDELAEDLTRLTPSYIAIDENGKIHKDPEEELGHILHSLTFLFSDAKIAQVDFSVTCGVGAGEGAFAQLLEEVLVSIKGTQELGTPLHDLKRVLFHPRILDEVKRNYVLSPDNVKDAELSDILRKFESNSPTSIVSVP